MSAEFDAYDARVRKAFVTRESTISAAKHLYEQAHELWLDGAMECDRRLHEARFDGADYTWNQYEADVLANREIIKQARAAADYIVAQAICAFQAEMLASEKQLHEATLARLKVPP